MVFDSPAWIKRADEVLSKGRSTSQTGASEAVQFATSMLTALYGPQSTQLRAFSSGCDAISKAKPQGMSNIAMDLSRQALGAITNAVAELQQAWLEACDFRWREKSWLTLWDWVKKPCSNRRRQRRMLRP